MSRGAALAQSQRSVHNPLVLGNFSTLSIRYLRGRLGPLNQVIGRADTRTESRGGYGGGTYNHWFRINLERDAWIIVKKGPPRPNYIEVSAYDLNRIPIEGREIFEADSIENGLNLAGEVYIPYLGTVMGAQSNLYNTYSATRLDHADDRYYPLGAGGYLLCVSTTRNELLDYEVAVVIEFPITELFWQLEDDDDSVCLQETEISASEIVSPVSINTTLAVDAFSENVCAINSGITVTVNSGVTWLIGSRIANPNEYKIYLEPGDESYFDTVHDHSLSEWRTSWFAQHQDTDPFPDVLVPLANRP